MYFIIIINIVIFITVKNIKRIYMNPQFSILLYKTMMKDLHTNQYRRCLFSPNTCIDISIFGACKIKVIKEKRSIIVNVAL